jgi:molybdopterin synthase catalytic subunit
MIKVQTEDFSIAEQMDLLTDSEGHCGAIASFVGLVRDLHDEKLNQMHLEHYPGMTERSLEKIVGEAKRRWDLLNVRLIHRVGALKPCDQIVFVGVSSAHRENAFAACQFIMDYLKRDAPFWKKENTASGERWVAQKASDLAAAKRWSGGEE